MDLGKIKMMTITVMMIETTKVKRIRMMTPRVGAITKLSKALAFHLKLLSSTLSRLIW